MSIEALNLLQFWFGCLCAAYIVRTIAYYAYKSDSDGKTIRDIAHIVGYKIDEHISHNDRRRIVDQVKNLMDSVGE